MQFESELAPRLEGTFLSPRGAVLKGGSKARGLARIWFRDPPGGIRLGPKGGR